MKETSSSAPRAVGADIAKAEVVIAEVDGMAVTARHRVPNKRAPLQRYLQQLVRRGFAGKLVVESTGFYHWPLVLAAQEQGVDVRLINPLMAAKYRQGEIRRCKSDPADARVLAFMGCTEPHLPPTCTLTAAAIRLRQLLGLQKKLQHLMQQLRAVLQQAHEQAAAWAGVSASASTSALQANLKDLRAQHAALGREIAGQARAQADAAVAQRWGSLPGVSAEFGAVLAALLRTDVRSAGSWVAFAGLDISVNSSGTHVGPTHLTKRGNAFLRKRLFQAAWAAKMHDAHARAYYEYLHAQGRRYVECLLMIARKLLRAAFVLIKEPTRTCDSARLFALPT